MSDKPARRVAVVGASAGLGRCIGIGLAQRDAQVAFLARRHDRLVNAANEAERAQLIAALSRVYRLDDPKDGEP